MNLLGAPGYGGTLDVEGTAFVDNRAQVDGAHLQIEPFAHGFVKNVVVSSVDISFDWIADRGAFEAGCP